MLIWIKWKIMRLFLGLSLSFAGLGAAQTVRTWGDSCSGDGGGTRRGCSRTHPNMLVPIVPPCLPGRSTPASTIGAAQGAHSSGFTGLNKNPGAHPGYEPRAPPSLPGAHRDLSLPAPPCPHRDAAHPSGGKQVSNQELQLGNI